MPEYLNPEDRHFWVGSEFI